ncbi:MAG: hypothetical protein ACYDBB_11495 [Armatimonadota bacterium]
MHPLKLASLVSVCLLLCAVMVCAETEPFAFGAGLFDTPVDAGAKSGMYQLASFGKFATVKEAEGTYQKAALEIIARGGGMLVIPATAPQEWKIRNTFQQNREGKPTLTVLDLRNGYENYYLPSIGSIGMSGWAGQRLSRTINIKEGQTGLDSHGCYQIQEMRSLIPHGTSSYNQWIIADTPAGKNQRVYLPTIRGIFPGQILCFSNNPGSGDYEVFTVKSADWDKERALPYLVGDFTKAHPKGSLIWNKHVSGIMMLENNTQANNQTMDFQVTRHQYAQGDAFLISASFVNQGDVFSGGGDEAACIYNAETIYDAQSFHSVVEQKDPTKDELIYTAGNTEFPFKLASCRPLININEKKWITGGTVMVVAPDDWAGMFVAPEVLEQDGFTVNLAKLQAYKGEKLPVVTWQQQPVKKLQNTYKGKAYPSLIKNDYRNHMGGCIIGSPDCGWTKDVVGRFFTIADPTECITPSDPQAGYATPDPKRNVYRWYLIRAFNEHPDGTKSIRIERIRWAAVNAGAPLLFDKNNYTRDGHEVKMRYIIAPGAFVTDVGEGWEDSYSVSGNNPRKIKLAGSPDKGTPFDFTAGDPIELAVGPDPANPLGLRVRFHNQMPSTLEDSGVAVMNLSRVAMHSAFSVSSSTARLEDIPRSQKDKEPSFVYGIMLGSTTRTGLNFGADVTNEAILFSQPNNRAQIMRWLTNAPNGATTLTVSPDTGNMEIAGGCLSLNKAGLEKVGGISATATRAKNLRGINAIVTKGVNSLTVTFPQPEPDANYSLNVQPNWMTMDSVIRKGPKGFTVQFSVPAPEKAAIDWQLIR